jgi:F-type H+-transporting ATPase subunit b
MLIVSFLIFLVIIFVVMILVFRQIMAKNVVMATGHLEELSQTYASKEKDLTKQAQEIKQKSEETIRSAQDQAQRIKAEIVKDSEGKRDAILEQARLQSEEIIKQAEKSRQLLLAEIEERIAREAVDKACELIGNALPEEFKQNVHSRWVKELVEGSFSNLEHLHIPKDIEGVKIISAFSLDQDERKTLNKKLKDILGYEAKIHEEVDPKIVAGFILNLGSLVLDGSLKNKIKENSKNI